MPEFLKLLPPENAMNVWFSNLPASKVRKERIETANANGRIIVEDIKAPHPMPSFSRSTVDGYAVRAKDTYGSSEGLPSYLILTGEVLMGRSPEINLVPGAAVMIHTGGMLPEGADSVVMLEQSEISRPGEMKL